MLHNLRSSVAQLTQQCCTTCASMLRKKWQCAAQKFVLWLAIPTDIFEQEKGYYMLLDPQM